MTTAGTVRRPARADGVVDRDGPAPLGGAVPFRRLVRVEVRKQVDTRAGRWLLALAGATSVALIAALLWTVPAGELTWQRLTTAATLGWSVVLPLLGVLTATGEWSQRTALTTFALEPRRERVVLAKLAAACALAFAVFALTLAAAALLNAVGARWRGGDGSWALEPSFLVATTIELLVFVVMGVAFGLVLGSTSAAVVAFLVLPALWSVVAGLVPALQAAAPWLDLVRAVAALDLRSPTSWAQLATSVGLWVVLPLLLGLERTRRRDVA